MNDRLSRQTRQTGLVALLVALSSLTALSALSALVGRMTITPCPSRLTGAVPPAASHAAAGQPGQGPLPRSAPVRVSIPAIGATSSLVPLGLNPDGTMQVPPLTNPMQAGWYAAGPSPGERGPGVILGHIDGRTERGIFFLLRELRPGDWVLVTRQDGLTARFVVYHTEQVPKNKFPTEKVYGTTAVSELRLITCGGVFDQQSGNYNDNLIVFAFLAAST